MKPGMARTIYISTGVEHWGNNVVRRANKELRGGTFPAVDSNPKRVPRWQFVA